MVSFLGEIKISTYSPKERACFEKALREVPGLVDKYKNLKFPEHVLDTDVVFTPYPKGILERSRADGPFPINGEFRSPLETRSHFVKRVLKKIIDYYEKEANTKTTVFKG